MRLLTNICTSNLEASRDFYVSLLGLSVQYDSDWYIQLCVPNRPEMEYGLIRQDHALVPEAWQQNPTGMYVTFVVDDVDAVYRKAQELGLPTLQEPRNEFYGQRRFLTQDPSGCLIDISAPWPAE